MDLPRQEQATLLMELTLMLMPALEQRDIGRAGDIAYNVLFRPAGWGLVRSVSLVYQEVENRGIERTLSVRVGQAGRSGEKIYLSRECPETNAVPLDIRAELALLKKRGDPPSIRFSWAI